ncbi:Bifunctional purine biosynthetic protein ADE1 [Exophiala xenobiotica]|uniref:Bifunctional purine biosynthetic protein ADE1 n=1 Tax=Vermiconidia calcicola TaxID=1690605 RepID=A0AAV9QM02_9PEZI|nr:Bifunctional purine biosynthetic protein ADE1 [Exophiala xenobiotica]KAK5545537.1 Bifunctional purine biosynthetic protein ADE1 [Vermiconidia calcicola]
MAAERLRILVIGSGGREHALAWKLSKSPLVDVVHVAPGNGGTETENIVNVNIAAHNFTDLVHHAKNHGLNLVVVGPEAPLVDGVEGFFRRNGIRCFGPSQAAARMEGSKAFSKDFMQRHGIPTAAFRNFTEYEPAQKYLDSVNHGVVIKADGLAAGKGVIIPTTKEEAREALKKIMVDREFGSAGSQVVIEEFLEGEELSVLSFSDGYTIRSLPPAQDHKRALDGDQGPNTGGMGCYAPTRVASKELIAQIDREIVQPTVDCMRREGMPFVGMLFTGLMITKSGPKVLEYNVRGGDPETQTLLPLLSEDTDLAKVMLACTEHWLDGVDLKIESKFAATVVACAEGYPDKYAKNRPITIQKVPEDTFVFHAGTSRDGKQVISTGGRVIASTATATTLEEAVAKAYKGMDSIKFQGMHFRKDIAHRAFSRTENGRQPEDAAMTYASAGVSIDAGNDLVTRIKPAVKSTSRPGANAIIGGFGGAFDLARAGYNEKSPVIIGAIDGVGTKLKIAYAANIHDTVGIDLVAMNVNDLVVQGAEPLMFLDCYTCSILDVDIASDFVRGVCEGCKRANCALVGGETAEMPGLLSGTEYDAVGAAIGALDTAAGKRLLPDMESMVQGDILLGLASDGIHSNGFSLVRRIVEKMHLSFSDQAPWDLDTTVGKSLLTPTRIYVVPLLQALKRDLVKGMAHITGGGLTENVPRMLPDHLTAEIDVSSWERPAVFDWLQKSGRVSSPEMGRTFNNGIGMVLVVSDVASGEVRKILEAEGETVFKIGKLVNKEGQEGCELKNLDTWKSS